jgi:type IV secretion system protein VirB1
MPEVPSKEAAAQDEKASLGNPMKLLLVFSFGLSLSAQSRQAVEVLSKTCLPDADPVTVLAIVRTESSYNPLALSVNYPATMARSLGYPNSLLTLRRQPRDAAEALSWIEWFSQTAATVSVGLMQVNVESTATSHASLLDPCTNLKAGWEIFRQHYARAERAYGRGQIALRAAISAYNTGSMRAGFQNGYVASVLNGGTR